MWGIKTCSDPSYIFLGGQKLPIPPYAPSEPPEL